MFISSNDDNISLKSDFTDCIRLSIPFTTSTKAVEEDAAWCNGSWTTGSFNDWDASLWLEPVDWRKMVGGPLIDVGLFRQIGGQRCTCWRCSVLFVGQRHVWLQLPTRWIISCYDQVLFIMNYENSSQKQQTYYDCWFSTCNNTIQTKLLSRFFRGFIHLKQFRCGFFTTLNDKQQAPQMFKFILLPLFLTFCLVFLITTNSTGTTTIDHTINKLRNHVEWLQLTFFEFKYCYCQ